MPDWFQKRRIGDLPNEAAFRWGEREALVFNSSTWTFADFAKRVDEVAKGLVALGVERGDRVAIWVSNRPEWLFAFFAATRIGAIAVPMSTKLRVDDAARVIRTSGASVLIIRERVGVVDFVELAQKIRGKYRQICVALPGTRRTANVVSSSLRPHSATSNHQYRGSYAPHRNLRWAAPPAVVGLAKARYFVLVDARWNEALSE